MTDKTPNTYYTKEMRYLVKGDYRAFFEHIADRMNIKPNHRAASIDLKNKQVTFHGKIFYYKNLISTLSLG